ncbi:hypothetical protein IAQ61_000813 [Plenodomus lingam]|uniref:uncharacterized protein n=1 Tax=Leptosphaeria maculans TaxID=5022 RepID=UPI003324C139|nr:hypothetical protein IAQ61_000813 [Plenodomus lingam]
MDPSSKAGTSQGFMADSPLRPEDSHHHATGRGNTTPGATTVVILRSDAPRAHNSSHNTPVYLLLRGSRWIIAANLGEQVLARDKAKTLVCFGSTAPKS